MQISRFCLISRVKNFLSGKEAVERGGKAGINRHMHENFDDLFARDPNIQPGFDMHFELRLRISHRCQGRDRRDLALAQAKPFTRVNIAEGKFEYIGRKIGRDVGECGNHALAGLAVDFSECALTALEPALADVGEVLRHSP
jgi:hypothetical protein